MKHIGSRISRRRAVAVLGTGAAIAQLAHSPTAAATSAPIRLERAVESLRMAMVAGDQAALEALLHEKLIYMHSSGHSQTKADVMRDLAGRRFFASLTNSDITIDVVGRTGTVVAMVDQVKNLPDGKTRASRIKVLTTWVVSGGRWRLLSRVSAIIYSPLTPRC